MQRSALRLMIAVCCCNNGQKKKQNRSTAFHLYARCPATTHRAECHVHRNRSSPWKCNPNFSQRSMHSIIHLHCLCKSFREDKISLYLITEVRFFCHRLKLTAEELPPWLADCLVNLWVNFNLWQKNYSRSKWHRNAKVLGKFGNCPWKFKP